MNHIILLSYYNPDDVWMINGDTLIKVIGSVSLKQSLER